MKIKDQLEVVKFMLNMLYIFCHFTQKVPLLNT